MSYSQSPPSPHPLPNVRSDVTQENIDACEETMNDEVYNQLYYMRMTGATPSETLHSTTLEATDSPVNCATNIYDTVELHDSYNTYSQTASPSQFHSQLPSQSQSQSQLEPQLQVFHPVPRDFQDVSNEFASLAMSSYEIFQQSQQDYLQHQYAFWEESTIPDGGMFPIDIPLTSSYMDAQQQQSTGSEFVAGAPLSTVQQEVQPVHAYSEPIGGETLVPPPVRYDDDDIPRNDPSWLSKPQKHPWVQSGRAYLCPYDICQVTIVQKKNRRRHNAVVHGVE